MQKLIDKLRDFAKERDWEQYHSPKNLAMALSVEVAELMEHFQWLTQAESHALSPEKRAEIKDEIGDVLIYLTNLADKLGIDPVEAAHEKVEKNRVNYPVSKAKGNTLKYREFSV
jgi:dCTP diphosphatase